jgi:hypothetical protein
MTPAEIKAAAAEKIALLNEKLRGEEVVLNLSEENVPNDTRAEALLNQADRILTRPGRHVTVRHAARVRELLSRYVAA